MNNKNYNGHCFCGAVRWHAKDDPFINLVCHCSDCQRATSSPFTAFIGLSPENVYWEGEINHYESSPETTRGFCPKCGTRLYFKSNKWSGGIHIHAATLEDGIDYNPSAQVVMRSRADWLDVLGDIPAHQDFAMTPKE